MPNQAEFRLGQYTLMRPQEVLLVKAEVAGELDQIAFFKGYASSLTRPTAFDPDLPVLPDEATILAIDRLEGPFDPNHPRYLEQAISWEAFQALLAAIGV